MFLSYPAETSTLQRSIRSSQKYTRRLKSFAVRRNSMKLFDSCMQIWKQETGSICRPTYTPTWKFFCVLTSRQRYVFFCFTPQSDMKRTVGFPMNPALSFWVCFATVSSTAPQYMLRASHASNSQKQYTSFFSEEEKMVAAWYLGQSTDTNRLEVRPRSGGEENIVLQLYAASSVLKPSWNKNTSGTNKGQLLCLIRVSICNQNERQMCPTLENVFGRTSVPHHCRCSAIKLSTTQITVTTHWVRKSKKIEPDLFNVLQKCFRFCLFWASR